MRRSPSTTSPASQRALATLLQYVMPALMLSVQRNGVAGDWHPSGVLLHAYTCVPV